MHVLITGGAGFIGSNLTRYLLGQSGISAVTVVDDLSTGYRRNLLDLNVRLVEASILDYGALEIAAEGVDAVVHLAAIPSVPRSIANPHATHEANTTGTLNVLEVARHREIEHVIVASSSSVYGANPSLPKDEFDWTRPMSPYGVSKQATEGYALAYAHSYGMRTLAFRFFNVYGPGQSANHAYAAVIPRFLRAALVDEPLEIHGDGSQVRDFTYVDSVCAAIHRAIIGKIHDSDPVNLAFGTRTSLLELADILEQVVGKRLPRRFVEFRAGDVRASQASATRIEQLFPDVLPIELAAGLRKTLEWYRAIDY